MSSNCLHSILVCDDKSESMSTLLECLRDSGYQVTTVNNGIEATLIFESLQPDLIVANVNMEKLDGVSMVAYLKVSRPALKSVLLTGSVGATRKALVDKLDELGATYVMSKSAGIIEMVSCINLMLLQGGSRSRKPQRRLNLEDRLN